MGCVGWNLYSVGFGRYSADPFQLSAAPMKSTSALGHESGADALGDQLSFKVGGTVGAAALTALTAYVWNYVVVGF